MALTGLTAVSRLTPRVLREVDITSAPDGDDAPPRRVTPEHGEGSRVTEWGAASRCTPSGGGPASGRAAR